MKTTHTVTNWERVGGVIQLVESTEEYPNPSTYHVTPGDLQGQPSFADWEFLYEAPVTQEEWLTAAEDWMDALSDFADADDSGSDSAACPPGDLCAARRYVGAWVDSWQSSIETDFFQYRIKLDKCCGFKSILSGWREVLFTKEYLDWLADVAALGSSDDIPPSPEDLEANSPKKQWLWEGAPPLCPEDSSASGYESDYDPFDDEAMWSPWSLTVKLARDKQGRIELRNYWQKCYGSLPDFMPAVMGDIDLSDDSLP